VAVNFASSRSFEAEKQYHVIYDVEQVPLVLLWSQFVKAKFLIQAVELPNLNCH
jgi:hypothetical protein